MTQDTGPDGLSFTPSISNGVLTVVENFDVNDLIRGLIPESNTATWSATQLTGTPSLAAIAGTWTLDNNNQMVIAQDGSFTLNDDSGTDPPLETSCQVTGQISISDTAIPVYTIAATETNGCEGNVDAPGEPGKGVLVVQQGKLFGGIIFTEGGGLGLLLPL